MIKIDQYFSQAQWQKFTQAAEGQETPLLVVDLSRIKTKYEEMVTLFPKAKNPLCHESKSRHRSGQIFG